MIETPNSLYLLVLMKFYNHTVLTDVDKKLVEKANMLQIETLTSWFKRLSPMYLWFGVFVLKGVITKIMYI